MRRIFFASRCFVLFSLATVSGHLAFATLLETENRIQVEIDLFRGKTTDYTVKIDRVIIHKSGQPQEVQNPTHYFSLSDEAPTTTLKLKNSSFTSHRRLSKMKQGHGYVAEYGLYFKDQRVDTFYDVVQRAHTLSSKKGSHFSQKNQSIDDHSSHSYLFAVSPNVNSLEFQIDFKEENSEEFVLKLLDESGKEIETKNLVAGSPLEKKEASFILPTRQKKTLFELIISVKPSGENHYHPNLTYNLSAKAYALTDGIDFLEDILDEIFGRSCRKYRKASRRQIAQVNKGNERMYIFLKKCQEAVGEHRYKIFCDQIIRPNPLSRHIFNCTYGNEQPHQLIHPSESTWKYAITAIQLLTQVSEYGAEACEIRNWWRPEPYNKNVDGAAGRHPYGTAVDVHFCSKTDQINAHVHLCRLRAKGKLRALGFYPSNTLHLGVGDRKASTWGRSCSGATPIPSKPSKKQEDRPDGYQKGSKGTKTGNDGYQKGQPKQEGSDSDNDGYQKDKSKKSKKDKYQK